MKDDTRSTPLALADDAEIVKRRLLEAAILERLTPAQRQGRELIKAIECASNSRRSRSSSPRGRPSHGRFDEEGPEVRRAPSGPRGGRRNPFEIDWAKKRFGFPGQFDAILLLDLAAAQGKRCPVRLIEVDGAAIPEAPRRIAPDVSALEIRIEDGEG